MDVQTETGTNGMGKVNATPKYGDHKHLVKNNNNNNNSNNNNNNNKHKL